MRINAWIIALGTALAAVAGVAPAAAQDFGVRGGASLDPDGVYVGGHVETAPLVDRLHFRPNLEIGLGDITVASINFEFVYKFPRQTDWGLYLGGGPAVNFYNRTRPRGSNTSTDAGLNFMVGVERRTGLFFEFKVGAFGSPDAKFGIGYTF
jgi:hypothetical protein